MADVKIEVRANGPNRVTGPIEIVDQDGNDGRGDVVADRIARVQRGIVQRAAAGAGKAGGDAGAGRIEAAVENDDRDDSPPAPQAIIVLHPHTNLVGAWSIGRQRRARSLRAAAAR